MTSCPHCGSDIGKPGKPRSVDQLRRYFKMIRVAFSNWPENNDFGPDNPEHLRKYLQVKAGYREVIEIPIKRLDKRSIEMATAAAEAAMKLHTDYCWVIQHKGALLVVASKSIKFETLPHGDFCALNDHVAEIIEGEIGIKIDDLMKEVEAA
jgi:hypothetical protein